jgi:hypothetical protein
VYNDLHRESHGKKCPGTGRPMPLSTPTKPHVGGLVPEFTQPWRERLGQPTRVVIGADSPVHYFTTYPPLGG